MDFEVLSSSAYSENLKCATCKNYLSYLPIYITAKGKNICGRCQQAPDADKYTRNLAFEALSQIIHFPCRFKNEGCVEKMSPKDVPQHEEACPYKIITCPSSSFTGCHWEGAFPTVLQHCLDKHFDFFLDKNGEFTLDLSKTEQRESFIRHKEALYIFSRKFDATMNMLQCAIYHIKGEINMENYTCALTLKNGRRVLSDECCTTAYQDKEYMTVVLDCLKRNGEVPVVVGQIAIEKCIEDEAVLQERINEQLLQQLQCANCCAYVLPPICYFLESKIYCSECSTTCEIFKNYNLDNMASLLNYPCKYTSNGCSVVLKPEQMRNHQVVCPYGNRNCLFAQSGDCLWTGMGKDMFVHIEENHSERFVESGNEILVDYASPDTQQFILKYSNIFFRVVFSTFYSYDWNQYIFNWTVQKIGCLQDTFMYDIEIVDRHGQKRKFVGRKFCLPFTDKGDLFQSRKEYCSFNYIQLEDLLLDDYKLAFRINVL